MRFWGFRAPQSEFRNPNSIQRLPLPKDHVDILKEDPNFKEERHVMDIKKVVLELFNCIFNLGPRSLPI